MDQRSIVLFLHQKGMNAQMIHSELVEVLREEAVGYSTVTKYLRQSYFSSTQEVSAEDPSDGVIDHAILEALEIAPYASVRQIARMTLIPKSTVYNHLVYSLQLVSRHLRWVPHRLSDAEKKKRVTLSTELLKLLESMEAQEWRSIVTLDESWFYFTTDYEAMWLSSSETPPDRERHMVTSPKLMLTIVWNPDGFHVINVLPKGQKFNASYYVENILERVSQFAQASGGNRGQAFIVHADNARPHTARISQEFLQSSGLRGAPHPPYSPDLAPSDFFLFGYVKNLLQGQSFATAADLLAAVQVVLGSIGRPVLLSVFREWMQRLKRCIEINGDYVE